MKFEVTNIKECEICKAKDLGGYTETVSENFSSFESCGPKSFCVECFISNTFLTPSNYTFLKWNDKLFVYRPYYMLDFGFRPAFISDIEEAFNPARAQFEKWRKH